MITFQDVSFRYKDSEQAQSLKHVSFHIAPGEVVLLSGRSGCGKTTITRLINGLIPHFYEGNVMGGVTVAGQDVLASRSRKRRRAWVRCFRIRARSFSMWIRPARSFSAVRIWAGRLR